MLNYLVADSGPGPVERSGIKAVYETIFVLTNLSGLVNLVFPFLDDNSKRNVLDLNLAKLEHCFSF